MLRLDRVRLPAWVGGIGLFGAYVSAAIPTVYEDDLDGIVGLIGGPMGRLLTGPGHGFDEPTVDRVVGGGYGLYFLLTAALMSILLVSRHTRNEEQSGRAELVRAAPLGRHTPVAATLALALLANLAAGAALLLSLVVVGGFAVGGSVLLSASLVAVGLAFAGITTVAVQVTESSRSASGLAGAALGLAFVVRAGGDAGREGGSLLSWLSPLGWAQQTAPYVLDRWWPLALLLALTGASTVAGYALSTRRDLAASFFPVRPGPARAAPYLRSPLGSALRLQRASMIGWGAALVVSGVVFGAFADPIEGAVDDMPEVFTELFSSDDVLEGYLGYMAMFMGLFVAAFAVSAVQAIRSDETKGLVEPLLATPVSRIQWLGAHLVVIAGGVGLISVVVGLSSGLGAAVATGRTSYVVEVTVTQLTFVPAVLVVLGAAALPFGVAPRLVGAAWALIVYGLLAGTFGELLDLPEAALAVDPFRHVPQVPLGHVAATPIVVLTAIGAALVAAGLLGFRHREIDTR